jgi:hypothetical protein
MADEIVRAYTTSGILAMLSPCFPLDSMKPEAEPNFWTQLTL